MTQPKVILLNCQRSGETGDALRRMLESADLHGVSLKNLPSGARGELRPEDLLDALPLEDAALLLLLTPTDAGASGLARLLGAVRERTHAPVIVVGEEAEPDRTLELLRLGVADFITTPLKKSEILPRIWRQLERDARRSTPAQILLEKFSLKHFVGESPAFLDEINKIPLVAGCDAGVLISGETGTGKELCARAVHYLSPRASKPFIPVNCGAIPSELVENELFGHEREAFTGATSAQAGLLQEAHGGTLFLDEVDCLPTLAQTKLLRFLQEKEYRPLGSRKVRHADVRVIAAANCDFEAAVASGKLRADLYYRLNVIPLKLPALRERREDIPLLARHFLARSAARFNKSLEGFSAEAMQALVCHDWPGNVRELENAVERAAVMCAQRVVGACDLTMRGPEAAPPRRSFREMKAQIVAQFERTYLRELLVTHGGNITKAAETAQKNRRAFWQLLRKHRIDVRDFKPDAAWAARATQRGS
jgi:two-component system, NtrC family, response regulator GlrR